MWGKVDWQEHDLLPLPQLRQDRNRTMPQLP
jgi:hypothetical protein